MVYRHRKYVVLLGRRIAMLEHAARRSGAMLRGFDLAGDCLQYLSKCSCDLLIVDLRQSLTDGLGVLAHARQTCPWAPRLALASTRRTGTRAEAIRAGATECLEKPATMELWSSLLRRQLSRKESPGEPSFTMLTPTERRVVNMVLAGRSSKEIAFSLKRSKRTIDAHRANIMHKLGTSNLVGLARWAVSQGFSPAC